MPTPQQVQQSLNLVKEKQDRDRAESKHKETNDKLDSINESIKSLDLKSDVSEIVSAVKDIKIEVPNVTVNVPEIVIPEIKLPDIKVEAPIIPPIKVPTPQVTVNVPEPTVIIQNQEEIKVTEPNWLNKIVNPVVESIKNKVIDKFVLPRTASEAIPVRLSNGKKFYEVFSNMGSQIAGAVDTDLIEQKLDTQIIQISNITENNLHTGNDELRTFQENHVCVDNTTNTPLGSNATFTGLWQDCLNYQEVNVSIDTDQNSAINGLVIQWSADGTTIADTDVFSVYANLGTNYTPNPSFRYVRIVYTNGPVTQTRFNLMTILRRGMTGGSFHRIDSTLKDDSDGRLTISVPKLKTAANTYVSQQATMQGNAKISLEEIDNTVDIARESKQDAILTELESKATEETLLQLNNAISAIRSAIGTASDLRVTILSGVVTTVTTVTGITNFGGNPTIQVVPNIANITYLLANQENIALI